MARDEDTSAALRDFAINRRIATSVGTLAIADHGSGTPVILWPSLFTDHRFYGLVTDRLGPGWRTIRIDGPGFGASDPPADDAQPQDYAAAVFEVMDSLNVNRAIIAGCSWGSQIAAHAGVLMPERVIGVVMMNTPFGPSIGGHHAQVWGTRLVGDTRFWGRGVARAMVAPGTRATHPERVTAFVDAFADFNRRDAATTARNTLTRFAGLGDVLPGLQVPTVILMGELDTQYSVESSLPIARRAPTARIEIVPGCGHLAPLEAPEAVVAALSTLVPG